jgi:hypothetical protein
MSSQQNCKRNWILRRRTEAIQWFEYVKMMSNDRIRNVSEEETVETNK